MNDKLKEAVKDWNSTKSVISSSGYAIIATVGTTVLSDAWGFDPLKTIALISLAIGILMTAAEHPGFREWPMNILKSIGTAVAVYMMAVGFNDQTSRVLDPVVSTFEVIAEATSGADVSSVHFEATSSDRPAPLPRETNAAADDNDRAYLNMADFEEDLAPMPAPKMHVEEARTVEADEAMIDVQQKVSTKW